MRDRPSVTGLMHRKEIQAITAPLGVPAERAMSCTLGTGYIRVLRLQCPSLIFASEVYNALLVEAARPEFLPKFAIE
jgi:hypothetical protein